MYIEILGWLGSTLFALCGLPQAIQSYKEKSSAGMNWFFLLMWLFGEVFTLAYISTKEDVVPLLFNYICNFLFLSVIIWFKAFPGKSPMKAAGNIVVVEQKYEDDNCKVGLL